VIPYSRQNVTEEDIESVVKVLRSDFLTQGTVVSEFENALAEYCHSKHGIATSSATAALHVACLSLDVTKDDLVWVSAISFVASANCAKYCQADVDFVDVDSQTGLISVSALDKKFQVSKRLPKVLIVVHIAGQSCNMKAISELCERYKVRVIEDASHALGGRYANEPVGSCRYSDMSVFSFHPVKPITSGEGGALMTNDSGLAKRARLFACHGIERSENSLVHPKSGEWYYEQQILGFNYRLSDIHAALGLSQLKRLDLMVSERAELAQYYREALADLPVECLEMLAYSQSAWHLYIIKVDPGIRTSLFSFLRQNGFGVNLHYMPIPSQPYYEELGAKASDFPEAIAYSNSAISLPLFYGMNIEVIDQVVFIIRKFFTTNSSIS
jgi:UDP-4-amino-4,6-dideoxy-N-acetyl-beta-L-altrosamine transaminase